VGFGDPDSEEDPQNRAAHPLLLRRSESRPKCCSARFLGAIVEKAWNGSSALMTAL
jgi:hypothetical protein